MEMSSIVLRMSPTLITNVRIFDGLSVVSDCGYILIEFGNIQQISKFPLPTAPGWNIVDGSNSTLIPGLIDAHVHVYQDLKFIETAIQYGVTTVLDMHNESEWFKKMKLVADEKNDVADIQSAGLAATVKNGWPSAILRMTAAADATLETRISGWPDITDNETADQYVATNKAAGASFIKLMQEDGCALSLPFPTRPIPTPPLEVQKAVVDAAHRNNMLAVAHALTNDSVLQMLHAGVDGITHSSVEPINESVISAFKDTNAFIIPTFAVHASSSGEDRHTRQRLAADLADTREKENFLGCLHIMQAGYSIQNSYEQITILKEAGVDILCGTDSSEHLVGTRAGASVLHELWLYVNRCGFTPIEALASATSKIAERFKMKDRGIIEAGRKADLVLVKGNPTESIDSLNDIIGVWRNGERVVWE
ncbi:hypothetical protein N7481_008516 [Penicillium waksmanii]|uniref:uncharacterized protein n=1 Tax=Penicillium waksmanii TaxID=69791 RepID=UPI0025491086|nr:uncharacterized protein N7481_008516 [Penicillium waksmanii]KAJ5974809.1 hypothetical protein N7481_008516 [Penicillium waksmanii]